MKNPDGIRIDGVFYIPTRSRSDDVCETCDIKWFCGMYEKTNFPCEMFAKADNKIHFKKRSRNKKKE